MMRGDLMGPMNFLQYLLSERTVISDIVALEGSIYISAACTVNSDGAGSKVEFLKKK